MQNNPESFSYSPLPHRPQYTWPGGKRLALYLAFWVAVGILLAAVATIAIGGGLRGEIRSRNLHPAVGGDGLGGRGDLGEGRGDDDAGGRVERERVVQHVLDGLHGARLRTRAPFRFSRIAPGSRAPRR